MLKQASTRTLGLNVNCLTRVLLNGTTTTDRRNHPGERCAGRINSCRSVAYPNLDDNLYYYGSLTGLCWVQSYFKVYTAYGGQVHIFSTIDGSEINNSQRHGARARRSTWPT